MALALQEISDTLSSKKPRADESPRKRLQRVRRRRAESVSDDDTTDDDDGAELTKDDFGPTSEMLIRDRLEYLEIDLKRYAQNMQLGVERLSGGGFVGDGEDEVREIWSILSISLEDWK